MGILEGRQKLLKTAHVVEFVVSVDITGMSLILTIRCTVSDTGFA
jgi:hypothetical protein